MLLKDTSIIIPTYHEAGNLPTLVAELATIQTEFNSFEVIIVDDQSDDGTADCIENLQQQYNWSEKIFCQKICD
jgi:dolichol-phosphate mannosyltransferase